MVGTNLTGVGGEALMGWTAVSNHSAGDLTDEELVEGVAGKIISDPILSITSNSGPGVR